MGIRCIALDLDRTTLDKKGRLSPENRQAMISAMEQGVHLVIASGRSFGTLPREVTDLPGIEYAVTSNGAAVYHVPTGKCLQVFRLAPEAVEKILELTRHEPVSYEAFIDGEAYADADYIRNPVKYGATPQAIEYIRHTRHLEEDILGFIREHIQQLESMDLIVADPRDKERIEGILRQHVSGIYITSSVRQLIEISHEKAGKRSGLQYVMEKLGLTRQEVAAFGDGDNDAEMLAFAGCGIAVANASPACRAAADYVTRSHEENGVAHGIHQILKW